MDGKLQKKRQDRNIAIMCLAKGLKKRSHSNTAARFRTGFVIQRDRLHLRISSQLLTGGTVLAIYSDL